MVSDEMFKLATEMRATSNPSGVRHGVRSALIGGNLEQSQGGEPHNRIEEDSFENQGIHREDEVARDGIEPPTRGFSILCSTD